MTVEKAEKASQMLYCIKKTESDIASKDEAIKDCKTCDFEKLMNYTDGRYWENHKGTEDGLRKLLTRLLREEKRKLELYMQSLKAEMGAL